VGVREKLALRLAREDMPRKSALLSVLHTRMVGRALCIVLGYGSASKFSNASWKFHMAFRQLLVAVSFSIQDRTSDSMDEVS